MLNYKTLLGACLVVCFIQNANAISCAQNPCLNRGTCADKPGGVTCTCSSEYGGTYCQIVKPCDPDPCKNGGTCQGGCTTCGGGYNCLCPKGTNGVHCEYRPCDATPCLNGGTCSVQTYPNRYTCKCLPGFGGSRCELSCDTIQCLNGGTCVSTPNGPTCKCVAPWYGARCQAKLYANYCTTKPNPCENGGTCRPYLGSSTDGVTSTYCCQCAKGFKGKHCQEATCVTNPCVHGTCEWGRIGSCGYRQYCKCPIEWWGSLCQYASMCISNPCQNGGRCYNVLCPRDGCDGVTRGEPMYTCRCPLSYGGKHCEKKYAAECRLWADPWYVTFDGLLYGNQASCRQILAKTCTNAWPIDKIPAFQVWVCDFDSKFSAQSLSDGRVYPRRAEHRKLWWNPTTRSLTPQDPSTPGVVSRGVSLVHKIGFDMYGKDIVLEVGKGVSVDWRGEDGKGVEEIPLNNLPWPQDWNLMNKIPLFITVDKCDPLRQLAIIYRGHGSHVAAPSYEMVVYMATIQLSILFSHQLAEILKPLRVGQQCPVCGMCGNYDTQPLNDFLGRSHLHQGFLETFLVKPVTPAQCDPYLMNTQVGRKKRAASGPVKEYEECTDEVGLARGQEKCGIINRQDGPFGECYAKNTQRQKMFTACVNDVCLDETFLESHLEAYHSLCGRLEIEPGDWRTEMGLKFPCASKQEYKRCINRACVATCNNTVPCEKDANNKWDTVCQEGCVCKEGFIWDEISNQCITQDKCGTTKFKFPTGFIGLGGALYKPPVFRCCQKTEAELAEKPYCRKGEWCFPPGEGARLIKDKKCKFMAECTESGEWNLTKLDKGQKERDPVLQKEIFDSCLDCQKDVAECDDFSNYKHLHKVAKYHEDHMCPCKKGSKEQSAEDKSGEKCTPRVETEEDSSKEEKKEDTAGCADGGIARCDKVCESKMEHYCARTDGWCIKKGKGFIYGECGGYCKCSNPKKGKAGMKCKKFKSPTEGHGLKCSEVYKIGKGLGYKKFPFMKKFNERFRQIRT